MVARKSVLPILGALMCLLSAAQLSGCQPEPEIVRIALVAPFEGRYREIGYDVIAGVKVAIEEFNRSNNRIQVELVAYDDGGMANEAIRISTAITQDPDVIAVIGHWRTETTIASAQIYSKAGIPLISYCYCDIPATGSSLSINLAPAWSDLSMVAQSWADSSDLNISTAIMDSDNVITNLDYYNHMESGSLLLGGPSWGLRQFRKLTGTENYLFITSLQHPDYSTMSASENFSQLYRELNPGAEPGFYALPGYQSAWYALWQAGIITTENSPPALDSFDINDQRITNQDFYIYRYSDQELELVETIER